MVYYVIKQENILPNIIQPEFSYASQIWSENTPVLLTGMGIKTSEPIHFLPFYQSTVFSKAFLVSAPVWEVWKAAQKINRYRPCAFGSIKKREIKPYALVMPRILDALHDQTEYFPNGDTKQIHLTKQTIGTNQIFAVKGSIQTNLIVSEVILEEMLEKGITGFCYETVAVEEG